MTNLMKILIAYDGSDCAKAALSDLQYSGLPSKAEAMVVSVAEQLMPVPASFGMVEMDFSDNLISGVSGAKEHAGEASSTLKSIFPNWEITTTIGMGSPASFIINKADEWKPDLIVIGSHGRSAIGRFLLGSVSMKLAHNASCSVRLARRHKGHPDAGVKIMIGIDGSEDSEGAAREAVLRQWPAGSQVRLVNASWGSFPAASGSRLQPIAQWLLDEKARIAAMMARFEEELRNAGLAVSSIVKEGAAKDILLEEAESWEADCIFIGAKGLDKIERILIGSVSSSIAARAGCSVEIVRRPQGQ